MEFYDREDAGRQLAMLLKRFKGGHSVVMALPRGGVVVGAEVARILQVSLGVILVNKISHPADPEFAIGAVAEDEQPVYNELSIIGVDLTWLKLEEEAAAELIERRRQMYFDGDYTRPSIRGRDVIIVDDGIATGLTMLVAVRWAQTHGAQSVVIAAPVASKSVIDMLSREADDVCVLGDPDAFRGSVGAHYYEFGQVDDLSVRQILRDVKVNPNGAAYL
ncbi:MAG: phosphoribosyl transferase [Candidatus Nomurabacteria bacterium]|nr:MAG: phosphoribosyl transferase [Candidatus Nomurabacteria bacterium]